jgi:hypothetical protein
MKKNLSSPPKLNNLLLNNSSRDSLVQSITTKKSNILTPSVIPSSPDKKCAPSKKYTDGSCFTVESLRKIATNYNARSQTKINVNASKKQLVDELEKKLSNKCDNQVCWLRLDIVKELDSDDIQINTFRPKGPTKKYEWLSTTHINEVIEQYQEAHHDFIFLGAVPYDFDDLPILGIADLNFKELESDGKVKFGIVFNLDEHYKQGSHWVALYVDLVKNQIYFFDSLGKKPMKRIKKFITRITKYMYQKKYNKTLDVNSLLDQIKNSNNLEQVVDTNESLGYLLNSDIDIRFNHIQHQFKDSECGVYSIYFIVKLVSGELFDSVINTITKDEQMNQFRKLFFRNVT